MSFPNVPSVTPKINIDLEDATNLLLSSIAFEELGLAHIINAEAEKIQFVLGTLEGQEHVLCPDIDDLLSVNQSVQDTLLATSKKEMVLLFKLQEVLKTLPKTKGSNRSEEAEKKPKTQPGAHPENCDCAFCEMERSFKDF